MLLPYKIINKDGRPRISVNIKGEETFFSPEQISSMVLSKLKERAEEFLGEKNVTKAVITVPAHFNDAQRQATKDAGKIAGLDVLRIVNEPTAAALAYELQNKYKNSSSNILIYDFGGGTFDVSIVTIDDGVLDVKATKGDPYLGGDDIDRCLTKYFIEEFKKKHNLDISQDMKAVRRLQQQCEKAKRKLSNCLSATIEIDSFYKETDFIYSLNRAQFDQINVKLFEKTIKCVEEIFKEVNMKKEDINEIVLVGGSTRILRVREMVKKFFNNKELNTSLNPDEAIAVGAARQAGIFDDNTSEKIKSILLYDISSLSLGIEVKGGLMSVIIPKNSKIPTSYTKTYQTSYENQIEVNITIYEGEREFTEGNHKLGEFILTGLRKAQRGHAMFDVNFDIDSEGMLTVTATENTGMNRKRIRVKSLKNHLSEKDIQTMIDDAEKYREVDAKRRGVIEAKMALQNYCYETKNGLKNMDISEINKQAVKEICEQALNWLSDNEELTKEDCVNKKNEVRIACQNLIKPQ